eukprot:CAMPEP_0174873052 /NCGR_PEP_ID=MMETSP1114-20130205/74266_1 /TAXON_ID=312471 /ORGANISM="Neobodo designis, Strain CCAP 1951/1" /LENGTH=280 /DNA_ID=CAMNT_0016108363 /DNA_START=44 /DNA_END=882 /DNA_ORIENTATION=-
MPGLHLALTAAATLAPAHYVALRAAADPPDADASAAKTRPARRRKSYVNEMKNAAATRIQGLALIIGAKKELRNRRANHAARAIQRIVRGRQARTRTLPWLEELRRYLAVGVVRRHFMGCPLTDVPERFRDHVAVARIQSAVRRMAALAAFRRRQEDCAALRIQNSYRRLGLRKRMAQFKQSLQDEARRTSAATKISAAARGFLVRKWFHRGGGKEELQMRQRTEVAGRQRAARLQRVDGDSERLAEDIGRGRRTQEERDILRMVLSCANPNADVVEWST